MGPRSTTAEDGDDLSPQERVEAARELGKAMRFVRAVKDAYWAGAIVLALPVVAILLVGELGLASLVAIALWAACVVGILRFDRNPQAWATFMAVWATLSLAWIVLSDLASGGGSLRLGVFEILAFVVVCGYWTAVGFAARVQRTVRRYPDLWMARRLRGETVDDERAGATTRHRDRAREERRARGRRLLVLGAVAGLGVVLLVLLRDRGPEAPPPPAVDVAASADAFRTAWRAGTLEDIRPSFQASSRDRYAAGLERIFRRRGWLAERPSLGEPRYVREGHYAAAHFPLPAEAGGGELYTSWAYDAATRTWGINALRFPRGE